MQRLDLALGRHDAHAVARALPAAWAQVRAARLEAPFARLFAPRLTKLPLTGRAGAMAYQIGLLSPDYESVAKAAQGDLAADFLTGLALGEPNPAKARTAAEEAIAAAFASDAPVPPGLTEAMQQGRLGEAILEAMRDYERAAAGELKWLAPALAAFRAVGLEDTARRAALQLMLLERN